jgi:hypothetical protein
MATFAELRAAHEFLELSFTDLWIKYFEVGGNRDEIYIADYLNGARTDIDVVERDHIIDALNDTFVDRGLDHPLSYGTS